ncbi:hypothetical protein GBA52_026089 [Prunus armeniaca]|nr:hypothetical protein GBA52_026089 [Prunus armeniaca]
MSNLTKTLFFSHLVTQPILRFILQFTSLHCLYSSRHNYSNSPLMQLTLPPHHLCFPSLVSYSLMLVLHLWPISSYFIFFSPI